MKRRILSALGFALVSAISPTANAFSGAVRILNAAGDQNFLEIQSAVDAAVDRDVILVQGVRTPRSRSGTSR